MSDPIRINVPRLGLTVTEVTFVEWLVQEGSRVSEGDVVCTVESDKAIMEIQAPASGVIHHLAQKDSVYPVGSPIGEIRAG